MTLTLEDKPHYEIMLFIPSLSGGGAERVIVQLANEFVAMGFSVHLVVASSTWKEYVDEIAESVNVTYLGHDRTSAAIPALSRQLRLIKPAVLLTTMGHAALSAKIALSLSVGVDTRLYIREAISVEFKQAQIDGSRAKLLNLAIGWVFRQADGVIATTAQMNKGLVEYYRLTKPVVTIPNPVIGPQFRQLLEAEPEISLPWDMTQKVVLGVGRLCEQKDFETLIRAFHGLTDRETVRLVILGEGPLRAKLETLIEDLGLQTYCWLPGFVSNPLPYFRRADVFVLSSQHEGLPNSLIQALAAGAPCVSTDCPTGPTDILQGGDLGQLVPVGDVHAITDAVKRALSEGRIPVSDKEALRIDNLYNARSVATQYLDAMMLI